MDKSSSAFDLVFAGAGCAGLSLLWHLGHVGWAEWPNQRILLIDPAAKTQNDRTWCFWEAGAGPFEAIVHRQWSQLDFYGAHDTQPQALDIAPYAYKMIRALDFYRHIGAWLATQPNVTLVQDEVLAITENTDASVVVTRGGEYAGKLIFNSIPHLFEPLAKPQHIRLLQHFCGWFIRSQQPIFDPARATLMDFRVPQSTDTRFVYTMPFDAQRALVEFTVFSRALLPRADYDAALKAYLHTHLGLADGAYAIEDTEFGVIPMTDAPFARQPRPRVVNIGSAGGRTKASTGYTFQRIQRDSQHIAAQFANPTAQSLAQSLREPMRARAMDGILLNVLDNQRYPGHRVFSDLFQRNPASLIFKFLDEQSNLSDDLRIMTTVNLPAFIKGALGWGAGAFKL